MESAPLTHSLTARLWAAHRSLAQRISRRLHLQAAVDDGDAAVTVARVLQSDGPPVKKYSLPDNALKYKKSVQS